MGAIAGALITGAVAVGTTAYGASQNKKAQQTNEGREAASRADYLERLKAAGKWANELEGQYNDAVESRPGLSWREFADDKIRSLDDPVMRAAYENAKDEDFDKLREFARVGSSDNVETLQTSLDTLSGGKFQEIQEQRNKLALETDAASRLARSYELAAPIRGGATTTKYDSKGNLVEGQRSDKQAFTVAQEVQTEVEREQKDDLASLSRDYMQAAQSQQEKASQYMQFFDATGYATAAESDRTDLLHGYNQTDEQNAFDMFKLFSSAAAGIAPVQPTYADTGVGNQLIASGIKLGADSLSSYGNSKKSKPTY